MRVMLALAAAFVLPAAAHAELNVYTDSQIYTTGSPLVSYGNGLPQEDLIVRLMAPDGSIASFDQIATEADGSFFYRVFTWPETSVSIPYGTYTVEVISTLQKGITATADIKFVADDQIKSIPIERHTSTLVFAPETAAVNNEMRIFVQVTSDGLLVGQNNPDRLLQTSHVHLPDGEIYSLSTKFQTLHNGLYYADYVPTQEGTYVFHIVTFNQGSVSHGSAATHVISQDLGGISDEIIRLNTILHETAGELESLKGTVGEFETTLDAASSNINTSVTAITTSVKNIEEASVQLNSLLFPIVAAIGIIVALQIAIIARRSHG